eukprot:4773181-Pyramimonas_sp.AAC.1
MRDRRHEPGDVQLLLRVAVHAKQERRAPRVAPADARAVVAGARDVHGIRRRVRRRRLPPE